MVLLVEVVRHIRLLTQRIKARLAYSGDRLPEILPPKWMVTFRHEQRSMEARRLTQIRAGLD